jgi:Flp pilus assembly protein TadG
MMRRRKGQADQGAAAVEFVLVLPVLLIVLFGIIDFGRLMYAKLELAEAAREGARAAALVSVDDSRNTINDIVAEMSSDMDSPYSISGCGSSPGPGDDARVTLVYHFSFVTPFLGIGGDDGLTLTQTAVMPCM